MGEAERDREKKGRNLKGEMKNEAKFGKRRQKCQIWKVGLDLDKSEL